jgi:hypothetical protein
MFKQLMTIDKITFDVMARVTEQALEPSIGLEDFDSTECPNCTQSFGLVWVHLTFASVKRGGSTRVSLCTPQ